MHAHAPPDPNLATIALFVGGLLFLVYMVGAMLSCWTFFGVPVSMRP